MNWLRYLAEANIYLGVFYLCYSLFLSNNTHYTLSRAYLLFSCVIAFVLPVLQLGVLKPSAPQVINQVVFNAPIVNNTPVIKKVIAAPQQTISTDDVLLYIYIAGAAIAVLVFGYRLYQLFRLMRKNKPLANNDHKVVILEGDNTAFSFFNYLFIGTHVPQAHTVTAHELVHIRQKHSVDIVFLEVLKAINWFNPFVYLLQRSLKTLHEYIADEQTAAQEQDALTYSSFLLNNAYGLQGSPIAQSFFNYNLLKKRIIMLNQKRSGRLARLKYLAILPLCAGMLCTSTLTFSKNYGLIDLSPRKDAHLKVAHKLPEMIKYFKIRDNAKDITLYADNLSFIENGVRKIYYAKSVTKADIARIQKLRKLTIQVLEGDKTKINIPSATFPTTSADTNKKKLLPPPPPPPLARGKKRPAPPKVSAVKLPPPVINSPAPPKVSVVKFPPPAVKAAPVPKVKPATHIKPAVPEVLEKPAPQPEPPVLAPKEDKDSPTTATINKTPLIFFNGVKFNIKDKIKPGQKYMITATDSVIYHRPGDVTAMKKWGEDAKDGVCEYFGNTTFTVK